MRKLMTVSLIALVTMAAAPAMAQGIYVGPGGVGVDTGIRHHHDDGDRGDRYNDRDRGSNEGRSVYRDGGYRNHRNDD